MSFSSLGLDRQLLQGVQAMGYNTPTAIQLKTIPAMLEGHDVIGCAQTGTGKTAAFALPILHRIGAHQPKPRVLIMEPTRELAAQVETAIKDLARFTNVKLATFYGGVGYGRQRDALRTGLDIIVATPGRLLDLMSQGACHLDHIQYVILDEADRMLDMGFLPDVRRILEKCPRNRQTALFSATIPPEIETLITWAMRTPQTIEVGARRSPAANVKHVVYPVAEAQKPELLRALLNRVKYNSVIIFCRTKQRADRIGSLLRKDRHAVAILHSNRTQREREDALRGFRDGRFEVLVATDIAARGLDIPDVSHVINYDVPQHPEDYVHRIGRTGRAENTGDAFTLMVAGEARDLASIEHFIGQRIERVKLEEFDYQYTALFEAQNSNRNQPTVVPRIQGLRIRGGYFCGPVKRRRR